MTFTAMRASGFPDSSIIVDAAGEGNLSLVEYCIRTIKINVNICNQQGLTALQKAAESGREKVIRYLLKDCKANLEVSGKPPLHFAVEKGHEEVTRVLLEEDARVEQRYLDTTAFYAACNTAHLACAEILLEYGADINVRCTSKKSSILDVCANSNTQISSKVFDWLLSKKDLDVNSVNKNNTSALHIACKVCNVHAIKCLLAAGANPYLKTRKGKKPLDLVSKTNREEISSIFKKQEAKVAQDSQALGRSQSDIILEKSLLI
jgi:ankyrin repeat protein